MVQDEVDDILKEYIKEILSAKIDYQDHEKMKIEIDKNSYMKYIN